MNTLSAKASKETFYVKPATPISNPPTKKKVKHFIPRDVKYICEAFSSGSRSMEFIAGDYQVTRETIRRLLMEHNLVANRVLKIATVINEVPPELVELTALELEQAAILQTLYTAGIHSVKHLSNLLNVVDALVLTRTSPTDYKVNPSLFSKELGVVGPAGSWLGQVISTAASRRTGENAVPMKSSN